MVRILDALRLSEKPNPLLNFHIQRTYEAFRFLKKDFSKIQIEKFYESIFDSFTGEDQKCRIEFNSQNLYASQIEISTIDSWPEITILTLAQDDQPHGQGLQSFKTNQRDYWKNKENVIGVNSQGYITETSRFNVFLKQNGVVYTPSLDSGCVNGCRRQYLVTQGSIEIENSIYPVLEKDFFPEEIRYGELYIANSLRGVLKALLHF